MSIVLHDTQASVELPAIFNTEFNEGLVHQVVVAYQAGARQGSKQQKNRANVTATGAKPWRQKGTGRARAGDAKSPIWRGGGVTFAQRGVRDYSKKVNKKMYAKAMMCIISKLIREEKIIIMDSGITVAEPKTKDLVAKLNGIHERKTLIVTDGFDFALELSARNIPGVYVCKQDEIDPVSLLGVDKVCMSYASLQKIEERLS